MPVASSMAAPATAEGGDTVWLDRETLLVGHGYRTGTAGIDALRVAFPDAEVVPLDLPHWNGAGEVMHLMTFISPLDRRPRAASIRGSRRSDCSSCWQSGGSGSSRSPTRSSGRWGRTCSRSGRAAHSLSRGTTRHVAGMERAGVDVVTYRGDEISRKGDGGPTCLTRPILRVE